MKRAAKQVLIVLLVVMAVIGTGNISAQADYNWKPKKVSIAQSAKKVSQGKEFEIRAKVTPIDAEDDYIRWEIISGKKYVKFEDRDRTGDEMDFIAVKPGKAKIRCYVQGKSKKKYGDTITVTVTNFRKNAFDYVEQTIKYNQPVNITTKDGNAVLLSEEDYSGIMETLYLVSAPGMREKIMDGIATPLADCVDETAVEW